MPLCHTCGNIGMAAHGTAHKTAFMSYVPCTIPVELRPLHNTALLIIYVRIALTTTLPPGVERLRQ